MNNDHARHIHQVHDALTNRGVNAARIATGNDSKALFELRGDWTGYTLIWQGQSLDTEDPLNPNGSWILSTEEVTQSRSPKTGHPLPTEDDPERTVDQILSCLKTLAAGNYVRVRA